jgi:tetratricopeptide (TPR) repeat protein
MKEAIRFFFIRIVLFVACFTAFPCPVQLHAADSADEISDLMEKGKALRIEGKLRKAEKVFSELLAGEPGNVQALIHYAAIQEDLKKPKLAAEAYRRALEIEPGNVAARRNLDQLNSSQEIQKPLYPLYRQKDRLLNRGLQELEAGRFDRAEEIFRLAAGLQVNDPRPRLYCAIARERQGRVKEAAADYEQIVAAFPDYAPAWTNLIIALLASGNREAANNRAKKAAEILPQHRGIRYLRVLTAGKDTSPERKGQQARTSGGRQEQ